MKKRFLAMLLCLSVLLMACACAAETEPPIASHPEHQESSPQFTLSEVNAESSKTEEPAAPSETAPAESEPQETISMEESDIELEPIHPIEPIQPIEPIKPEEKETTLEKVFSFDIGIDGVMEYDFLFETDPSIANIGLPGDFFADADGNYYFAVGDRLVRLNDGAILPKRCINYVIDVEICGNTLYMLDSIGTAYQLDISNGFASATVEAEYPMFKYGYDNAGKLIQFGDTVLYESHDNLLYTLDKTLLTGDAAPYQFVNGNEAFVTLNRGTSALLINKEANENISVRAITSAGISVSDYTGTDVERLDQAIFSTYDRSGNITSRFMMTTVYPGEKASCSVDFIFCDELLTVTTYIPQDVMVGKTAFEDVFKGRMYCGMDGNFYFVAYYLDHADVYLVNAGYSDVEFTKKNDTVSAEDSSIAPTSSAAESSADFPLYVDLPRETVKQNALEMMNYTWTIQAGNKVLREDTTLPAYLVDAIPGVEVEEPGIPYCRGGYHPKDVFEERLTLTYDDGDIDELYMTGNTHSGYYQGGTIGLDCGRFLCAAFEFSEGLHPNDILDYGHRVSSLSQLSEMDVIAKGSYYGAHAMFYQGLSGGDTVKVYETSSKASVGRTISRDTGDTEEELIAQGYKFLHVYFELDYNSSQHWIQCKSCTDYRITESHTMVLSETGHFQKCTGCDYMVALTPHTFTYTYGNVGHVATCTGCGYSVTATHSMTYTGYDANGHTRSCSCGYSVTATHTFSGNYVNNGSTHGRSCVCGYTETIAHTLSYHHNVDTHWRECSVCDYATAPVAHIFVNGRCRLCNALQIGTGPASIIAIPEEDELLPVPEDQKATL